jgi:RecJ-like exonuclease
MSPHVRREVGDASDQDPTASMAPGDEAPQGTPGAGENVCPTCNGSGKVDGATCQTCAGSGVVIEEIGGA